MLRRRVTVLFVALGCGVLFVRTTAKISSLPRSRTSRPMRRLPPEAVGGCAVPLLARSDRRSVVGFELSGYDAFLQWIRSGDSATEALTSAS